MPRIRTVDSHEADPELRPVFERFEEQRGNIPNMFRTMALAPTLARTAAAHLDAVMAPGTVDARLKEMLAVRVSQINACNY